MTINYSSLEKMDWWEVYEALHGEAKLPLSVHVPLNFPGAQSLTFCDCAMNAYCLPSPALNSLTLSMGRNPALSAKATISFTQRRSVFPLLKKSL